MQNFPPKSSDQMTKSKTTVVPFAERCRKSSNSAIFRAALAALTSASLLPGSNGAIGGPLCRWPPRFFFAFCAAFHSARCSARAFRFKALRAAFPLSSRSASRSVPSPDCTGTSSILKVRRGNNPFSLGSCVCGNLFLHVKCHGFLFECSVVALNLCNTCKTALYKLHKKKHVHSKKPQLHPWLVLHFIFSCSILFEFQMATKMKVLLRFTLAINRKARFP